MIADAPTDAALDAINECARGLADELLALLDLGDRQCAYISAMHPHRAASAMSRRYWMRMLP